MREEVEAVINEEGWTKSAAGKLWKVDSFLRESQRISGNGACMYLTNVMLQCFLTSLSSHCAAKSAKRLYIFKRDSGSCGLYDWYSASFSALWSSSCLALFVVAPVIVSKGQLLWSWNLRRIQVRENERKWRRKYKIWNGDSYSRLSDIWTGATCMVLSDLWTSKRGLICL